MRTWEYVLIAGVMCLVGGVFIAGWCLVSHWVATHQEYDEEKES